MSTDEAQYPRWIRGGRPVAGAPPPSVHLREVARDLYLGSHYAHADLPEVRAVVQCYAGCPLLLDGRAVLRVPLDERAPIQDQVIDSVVAFVRSHRREGEPVLIQGHRGVSRSVALAVAVLMDDDRLRLLPALERARYHAESGPSDIALKSVVGWWDRQQAARAQNAAVDRILRSLDTGAGGGA